MHAAKPKLQAASSPVLTCTWYCVHASKEGLNGLDSPSTYISVAINRVLACLQPVATGSVSVQHTLKDPTFVT